MNRILKDRRSRAFTLVELLIVLLLTSVVVMGLYSFLGKQRRHTKIERMKADIESAAQIAFFIIGRDIRRAGSNPKGWGEIPAGEPLEFDEATESKLVIRADLNGDGAITSGSDELITYEYIDGDDDADTIPDQVRRQSGNQLVIENVRAFEFCYFLIGGYWDCNPDPTLIKKVRLRMVVGTGHLNTATGVEDTKEIQMIIRPRNFDL